MNKKYIILLCIASTFVLGGCESCKGLFSAQGANSPASVLVEKHIEYLKLLTRQTFNQENKTPEELSVALAEIDKTGKDIKASYIVKVKNSCKSEEISNTDKLLSCVNDALSEGLKNKVEDPDEFMYEKCKDIEAPKSEDCSKVVTEFFEEFDKPKK